MTNKPMLSVERELLDRAVSAVIVARGPGSPTERDLRAILDNPSECRCKRYGKDNPHWPCPVHAEPATQHQGEPVAWVTQCHLSGLIEQAEPNEKATNLQYWSDAFPVFREQPAPVAVVMPERDVLRDLIAEAIGGDTYDCTRVWSAWGVGTMSEDDFVPVAEQDERLYEIADSFLAEIARLNGVKP